MGAWLGSVGDSRGDLLPKHGRCKRGPCRPFNEQERAPVRLSVILTVAALTLAGCNASELPNASPQSGRFAVSSVQDPIHQAQTSGFYAGR